MTILYLWSNGSDFRDVLVYLQALTESRKLMKNVCIAATALFTLQGTMTWSFQTRLIGHLTILKRRFKFIELVPVSNPSNMCPLDIFGHSSRSPFKQCTRVCVYIYRRCSSCKCVCSPTFGGVLGVVFSSERLRCHSGANQQFNWKTLSKIRESFRLSQM